LDNHGPGELIKDFKEMRLIITRYITKNPILISPRRIGISKDGFPKKLEFLKTFIDSGETSKLRFCMTLLCLTRCVSFKAEPNFSSITDPYKGTSDFTEFKEFIKIFVKDFNLTIDQPT